MFTFAAKNSANTDVIQPMLNSKISYALEMMNNVQRFVSGISRTKNIGKKLGIVEVFDSYLYVCC